MPESKEQTPEASSPKKLCPTSTQVHFAMCPPSSIPPAIELHEYSTDESIIKSLMQLKSGHAVPSNVLADVDPYQFTPSNLPAGMWYFWSGSKTDTKNGFWRSTGEACEIYNTYSVIGRRRTLQFYEGPALDGQKTNWIMQEYTTTEKYTSKIDPRALCKVFLVDDGSSGGGHLSESEFHVKNSDGMAGPSDVADLSSDQLLGDYVSRGDFLELDDLTSSAGSSCTTMSMTSEEGFDPDDLLRELGDDTVDQENQDSRIKMSMTSEECFNPVDLLRELGDDIVDQENQDSRIKLNLSVPAESKQVVLQQPTVGSLDVEESKRCVGQTSKVDSTSENKNTSTEDDTTSPPPPPSPPSSSSPPPPPSPPPPSSSSNGSTGSPKEEKKDHANRTKKQKMMKFLCFLAF